eukprot:TRINITY_DN5798_c0_g2_i2.p1 TRINITY_DN5798_c0_g2~~TRINITY_DN5798_c0_g2_i2.p1  ORF type:complete len:2849 (+),score=507.68 TRINITY_DN5798_c0_g2_i2:1043-8548(+)
MERKQYKSLYQKQLKEETLSPDEKSELENLDKKLSFEDLLHYRILSRISLKREGSQISQKQSQSKGWLSSWWYGSEAVEIPSVNWDEIYSAIEEQERQISFRPQSDWIKYDMRISLHEGIFSLHEDQENNIASVLFNQLNIGLQFRKKWHTLKASLSSISVTDLLNHQSIYPEVISGITNGENLFDLTLDINPENMPVDLSVDLNMKALNMVYNFSLIDTIVRFFNDPAQEQIFQAYTGEDHPLSSQKAHLQHIIDNYKTFSLNFDVEAPNIILPKDPNDKDSDTLALILGKLKVETSFGGKGENENSEFYDTFDIDIDSVQVILSQGLYDFHGSMKPGSYVIEPFNLKFQLEACKVSITSLPNIILKGELPSFRLNLSLDKIRHLSGVVDSVITDLSKNAESQANIMKPNISESDYAKGLLSVNEDNNNEPIIFLRSFFTATEVTILLTEESESISLLNFVQLSISTEISEAGSAHSVALSKLEIEDLMGSSPRCLLVTRNNENMEADVSISYESFVDDSPLYSGIDRSVSFRCSSIYLNWRSRCLAKLINFFLELSNTTQDIKDHSSNLSLYERNSTFLFFTVDLGNFTISVIDKEQNTVEAMLVSSHADITINKKGITMTGYLGDLSLVDLQGLSHQKNIIAIKGDKMIDFTIFSGRGDEEYHEYHFDFEVQSLNMLYISRFIDYIYQFQLDFLRLLRSEDIDKKTESTTRLKYTVLCRNPIIIIPDEGENIIYNDLGMLGVENSFLTFPNGRTFENITLKSQGLNSSLSVLLDLNKWWGGLGDVSELVKNIDFVIDFRRPLFPDSNKHPEETEQRVDVNVPDIKLVGSPQQFITFLDIIQTNLYYTLYSGEGNEEALVHGNAANLSKRVASEYEISLEKFSLELLTQLNNGINVPLCDIQGTNMSVNMVYLENNTSQINMELYALMCRDTRSYFNTNELYRTFVVPKSDETDGQLSVQYSSDETGNQKIILRMDSFRYIPLPNIVTQMRRMMIPVMYRLLDFMAHRRSRNNPNSAEAKANTTLSIEADITKQLLYLVEDLTNESSKVIIAESSFGIQWIFTNYEQIISIRIEDTEIYRSIGIQDHVKPVMILEPFDSTVDILMSDEQFRVLVVVKELQMYVSYNDLKLLYTVSQQKSWPLNNDIEYPPMEISTSQISQKFEMQIPDINFILIDDIEGLNMPFFKFQLSNFHTVFRNWSYRAELSLITSLEIDYYSGALELWEPFIEKWTLKLRGIDNSYTLYSKKLLNINYTVDLGKIISKTLERTQNIYNNEDLYDSLEIYPFYLENQSGGAVNFLFPGEEKLHQLLNHEKIPLVIPGVNERTANRLREMEVFLQLDGGPFLNTVDLSLGKHYCIVQDNHVLIYNVSESKNSKCITIESSVILQNCTGIPLEVKLTVGDRTEIIPLIDSNQSISVPAVSARKCGIAIRPLQNYDWSSDIKTSYLNINSIGNISCPSIEDPNNQYFFQASTGCTYDQMKNPFKHQFVISICPSFVIENKLNVPIGFVVGEATSGNMLNHENIISEGNVKDRNKINIHTFPVKSNLLIAFKLDGYSRISNTALIKLSNEKEDDLLLFEDKDSKQLGLYLNNRLDEHNVRHLTLYSRYQIVNRTGLPIYYYCIKKDKSLASGQSPIKYNISASADLRDMFWEDYLSHGYMFYSNNINDDEAWIKVGDSSFSNEALILSNNSTRAFYVFDNDKNEFKIRRQYQLVVDIKQDPEWDLGSLVTISPRYILVNNSKDFIFIKQKDVDEITYSLYPGERAPFHWPDASKQNEICIRVHNRNCPWSQGISFEKSISSIRMKSESTADVFNIRAVTRIRSSGFSTLEFIDDSVTLFRIENGINERVYVRQHNAGNSTYDIIKEKESSGWSWDYPTLPSLIDVQFENGQTFTVDFLLLDTTVCDIKTDDDMKSVSLIVGLENMTHVLSIIEKEIQTEEVTQTSSFKIEFKTVGISVIDEVPQEMVYMTLSNFSVEFCNFQNNSRSLEMIIQDCQIDNQLKNGINPVLLSSTGKSPVNFLQIGTRFGNEGEIIHLQSFSLLVREFNIWLDQATVLYLMSFYERSRGTQKNLTINASDVLHYEDFDLSEGQITYATLFMINPISFRLTYRNFDSDYEMKLSGNMASAAQMLQDTIIPNVTGAPIGLKGVYLEHMFASKQEIITRISNTYFVQLRSSLYQLIGSADIFGSPVSFIQDIASTAKEHFYEPDKGIVIKPKEATIGTIKLITASISGIVGSASKITNSIGTGVSMILDDDFKNNRLRNKKRRADNVVDGFALGMEEFGTSVFDGVKGVVYEPFKEAAQGGGVGGFFSSMGKGLVYSLVKPAVGVIDAVSRTAEGIQNTPGSLAVSEVIERKRPPRFFFHKRQISPYSLFESYGQELLFQLEQGKYKDLMYKTHIQNLMHGEVLIITNEGLLYLKKSRSLLWETPFEEIHSTHILQNRVVLIPIKYAVNLQPEDLKRILNRGKTIICNNENQANQVAEIIEQELSIWKTTDVLY